MKLNQECLESLTHRSVFLNYESLLLIIKLKLSVSNATICRLTKTEKATRSFSSIELNLKRCHGFLGNVNIVDDLAFDPNYHRLPDRLSCFLKVEDFWKFLRFTVSESYLDYRLEIKSARCGDISEELRNLFKVAFSKFGSFINLIIETFEIEFLIDCQLLKTSRLMSD